MTIILAVALWLVLSAFVLSVGDGALTSLVPQSLR